MIISELMMDKSGQEMVVAGRGDTLYIMNKDGLFSRFEGINIVSFIVG